MDCTVQKATMTKTHRKLKVFFWFYWLFKLLKNINKPIQTNLNISFVSNHLNAIKIAYSAAQKAPPILTVGWLNLASDAVHNFVDGIAIGASFSGDNIRCIVCFCLSYEEKWVFFIENIVIIIFFTFFSSVFVRWFGHNCCCFVSWIAARIGRFFHFVTCR